MSKRPHPSTMRAQPDIPVDPQAIDASTVCAAAAAAATPEAVTIASAPLGCVACADAAGSAAFISGPVAAEWMASRPRRIAAVASTAAIAERKSRPWGRSAMGLPFRVISPSLGIRPDTEGAPNTYPHRVPDSRRRHVRVKKGPLCPLPHHVSHARVRTHPILRADIGIRYDSMKELLRGAVFLHILHHASEEPVHGAWMSEELARHGYKVSPGTLYPTLHRMEVDGLLASEKHIVSGRVLRVYRTTPVGERALADGRRAVRELANEVLPHRQASGRDDAH